MPNQEYTDLPLRAPRGEGRDGTTVHVGGTGGTATIVCASTRLT